MSNPKDNPAEIYLVPDTEHGLVWSHDPAPGEGMKEEDATRYVRADLAPSGNDVLAQCISKLTLERNAQEAKRWAIQRAAEALLSAATDAEREEAQRKLNAVVKDEYDYEEVETPRPNYFDYRELQRQHDELQTMLFTERKKVSEARAQLKSELSKSLSAHLERQIAFSLKAFGSAKRTGGIIDHIKKELVEVEREPDDITEWIDLAMLALDGAWRHVDRTGMSFTQVAELVQKTLNEKLAKNEARSWPDWRTLSEDKAIEHNRSESELANKAGAL